MHPVNFKKAVRSLRLTNGVVEEVSDQEIMDAKAQIDRQGIGCEPASACSLAGIQKLVQKGIIKSHETIVGILTGHLLKDSDAVLGYHNGTLSNIEPHFSNTVHQSEPTVAALKTILNSQMIAPQHANVST